VANFKMDLGRIGWGGVHWIGLAQDRDKWRAFVNAVMNLRVSYNAGKLSSDFTTDCLSSSAQIHRGNCVAREVCFVSLYSFCLEQFSSYPRDTRTNASTDSCLASQCVVTVPSVALKPCSAAVQLFADADDLEMPVGTVFNLLPTL
jgi:hypothetical protein